VSGPQQVGRHAGTHVSQSDETDSHIIDLAEAPPTVR